MSGNGKRISVVTGANRGLGLGVAEELASQGHLVVMTGRDAGAVKSEADKLYEKGLDVVSHQLNVKDDVSINRLARYLHDEIGGVDVLVNNAGVLLDGGGIGTKASVLTPEYDKIRETMEVNVYGALKVANSIIPMMKDRGGGRIVNVSSGLGRLSDMAGGYPGYRISKAAINAVTRMLSAELDGSGILVNSASPGWVRTDMGGPNATRSIEEGIDTIVWLANLPGDGPSGGFFHDRNQTDW
jgi:NAD(P)-dependent dehydrogenase (short-subunit alcohol dehydrogenase family)